MSIFKKSLAYHAAIVLQKHIVRRNPIQLKRKEVVNAVKNTKSFPSRVVSASSLPVVPLESSSFIGKVSRVKPGK